MKEGGRERKRERGGREGEREEEVHLFCCIQVGLVEISPADATYRSLLGKLMQHDSAPLVNAYAAIEDLLREVQGYVKVCVFFQCSFTDVLMYMYHCTLYTVGVAAVPESLGHGIC